MQIYNNKINFKLVKKLKEVTSIKFSSLCILFNIFAMQYNNRNLFCTCNFKCIPSLILL